LAQVPSAFCRTWAILSGICILWPRDDLASGTHDGDTVTTASAGEVITISLGAGIALSYNTKYALVVRCTAGNSLNYIGFQGTEDTTPTDQYTRGKVAISSNSGSTWALGTGEGTTKYNDMYFHEGVLEIRDGTAWVEGDELHYFGANDTEQIAGVASRTFHVNQFHFPDPISEWRPTLNGAYLPASLTAKKCWIPLNFLKAGDIITAYNLVGDAIETNALTLDCKLVQVNKADPLTTTDITSGAITQIIADGNFDQAVNPTDTTVATDKQHLLELQGTTGVGDEIYVIGAEITITRL